jgi:hypothetical protein
MSHPARGPGRRPGIDGKASAADGRRWELAELNGLEEAAA